MRRTLLFLFIAVFAANYVLAQKAAPVSNTITQTSTMPYHCNKDLGDRVKWVAGTESMPGNLKAFQVNKGQFLNMMNGWKVLYGADYEGAKILFTNHGVIYTLNHTVAADSTDADDDGGKDAMEKEKEKQAKKKIVYDNFAIEWENVNPAMTVEAIDATPYYFGSMLASSGGKHFDSIKGYGKLVFHNVYPNIDITYTFHQDRGLEYSFTVHPGARLSDIKMFYHDPTGVRLKDGNIHLPTPEGDIIDHAPVTFQDGQTIESSFQKVSDNEVVFKTGSFDASKELIIDPWTVSPITVGFLPNDVHFDGAGNVYIYGTASGKDNYVQKYTPGGALSWTYDITQYGIFSGYISDLAVDVPGNSYVAGPYPYTNTAGGDYTMLSLTTGGTLRYFNNTCTYNSGSVAPNQIFEVWNLAYSCDFSQLVQAGSPTVVEEDVGIVTSATGNVTGQTVNTTFGEIYAGCIAPNGDYYAIAANPCFGCSTPGDDIVCYTLTAGTATFSWNFQSTYQWNDFDTKNPDGIATNGIAANCAYLYTTDGLNLDQRSLTNGTSLKTVPIPGGSATPGGTNPSGIATDIGCGYVYAATGKPYSVNEYDMNLNPITSQATPYQTYGVAYSGGVVAACGGATSSGEFVMVFAGQNCSTALTITHTNGSCATPATATVSTPTFCTGPYTYLWSPGGQTTQTATGLSTGVYTVTVGTASSCSTVTDTVTITSSGAVNVTATSTGSACTGSATATVTTGAAPFTYLWNTGATTSNITNVPGGTYTVTVKDSNGCIGLAIVTITPTSGLTLSSAPKDVVCFGGKSGNDVITVAGGTAPYKYVWSSGQTTSSINGLGAGIYTCTVTDASGCVDVDVVTITQPPQLRDSVISLTNPSCFGSKNGNIVTGSKGGANPLTYSWNNGETNASDTGLTAGDYTLTITDSNGCVVKILDTLKQPTQIVGAAANATLCNGSSATLKGNAVGGTGPYTYVWDVTTTAATITVTPTVTTTYTLTVTDAHGCTSAPVPVTVTIQPAPNVLFVPDTIQGCYPLCVTFKDQTTVVGGTEKTWYWTFGNGDTSTLQNPTVCYTKAGTFSVSLTVTSNAGCVNTLNIPNLITAYSHPQANFSASPQPTDIFNPLVNFTDQSTDQYGIISWFWTVGDATDSTATSQNLSHYYHDTGTFCPTLVVVNRHLCRDSIEHCIIIDPHFTLYIPNAFTPNDDDRNDVFMAKGIYVCSFEMYIFDRWGQQLYHTTDMTQGWTGQVNNSGPICQEDTYVYLIYAYDCEHHAKHSYLGRVSIIK